MSEEAAGPPPERERQLGIFEDKILTVPNIISLARLACVDPEPFGDQPDAEFPFVLNTGRTVEHWHTRTKTGRAQVLEALVPEAWVSINPADASSIGVDSGDRARLVSRRGVGRRHRGAGHRDRSGR